MARTPSGWENLTPPTRHEAHFGDRVVRCYRERPQSVWAMVEDAVARNPDGEALVCGPRRLTWRQVGEHVARLAAGLAARDVGAGDRVALFLGNGVEFPLLLWAAARLGAIAVPLSHRGQAPELRYMLDQCRAALLVHDADLGGRLPPASDTPSLKRRIAVGEWPGSEPFDALLASGGSSAPAVVDEEDVALILYTSGTTGHPKGAMITHLNLVHAVLTYESCMGMRAADRSLVAVPMSHLTGISGLVTLALRCASTLVVMPGFKAPDFLALAARERVTHTLLVPAMYALCLLEPDLDRHDLSAWRIGGYGGAPMPPATIAALAERLPRLRLMNCYGATETVVAVAMMPPDETALHPDRVGRVVPCSDVVVVDELGRELPPGAQGELWIRGATVVRGYWDDGAATAAGFTAGFWHSGDIGSITPDGLVGVHDRQKDMINRGGYKVYTTEVENALCEHPAVLECAVVARPCPVLGERVHAFVILRTAVGARELQTFCAARLSDYKVPETFTVLDAPLPRNAAGKILKRELRDRARLTPDG
jgi:acyl-CoA synthetase (AMP-forming)/AMP-acid ligase II